MNWKKPQPDWTATDCNWTCGCGPMSSGGSPVPVHQNLMCAWTATGPVGVSLNRLNRLWHFFGGYRPPLPNAPPTMNAVTPTPTTTTTTTTTTTSVRPAQALSPFHPIRVGIGTP